MCTKRCFVLTVLVLMANMTFGETNRRLPAGPPAVNADTLGAPVVVQNDTLFRIFSKVGTFSPQTRAEEIAKTLTRVLGDLTISLDSLKSIPSAGMTEIWASNEIIMVITAEDAKVLNSSQAELAARYIHKIKQKLTVLRFENSKEAIVFNSLYSALYLGGFIFLLWLFHKFFPVLNKKLEKLRMARIFPVRYEDRVLLELKTFVRGLTAAIKLIRIVLTIWLIYFVTVKIIALWPFSRNLHIEPLIAAFLKLVLYTFLLVSFKKSIDVGARMLRMKYAEWKGTVLNSWRIKNFEFISAERLVEILLFLTNAVKIVFLVALGYFYITLAFGLFSFSKNWSAKLLGFIFDPLYTVLTSFVSFLPNLFYIIVIIIVFRYLLKFVRFLFDEVGKGNITFTAFHTEWADPTYKIVRFLILVLAAIVIFPYLPGSNSPFFQGISVFVGVLFSLGSSTAISNMVSGVVITYMRPFRIGDRVKIADTVGDIIEKNLLITRVRTIKNVDITIPNAMVLGNHIINFSSSAKKRGLILHTSVTIGYDAPWKQIHELLISAAKETENILSDPPPFVLQTSLDDFYVSYEINAYTDQPNSMAKTYSILHSKIQDKFNEAGVEIMSPHYGAMRDGNQVTIPVDYLPKDYETPSFRLFGIDLTGNKKKGE